MEKKEIKTGRYIIWGLSTEMVEDLKQAAKRIMRNSPTGGPVLHAFIQAYLNKYHFGETMKEAISLETISRSFHGQYLVFLEE